MMAYQSVSVSHPGRVREQNEDALLADDQAGLWLVADGMGGHAGGEVASQLAVEQVHECLRDGQTLEAAIDRAHRAIVAKAQAQPELTGMGTTLVAVQSRGRRMQMAWVGDSRVYLIAAGQLQQLSVDHSFVQDMVLRGVLTEEEARQHPRKNLVRQALGQADLQRLQIDTLQIGLKPGQQLLLCSDGVHDMLGPDEIAQVFQQGSTSAQQISALREAVLATPASDNFSAVIVERKQNTLGEWVRRLTHSDWDSKRCRLSALLAGVLLATNVFADSGGVDRLPEQETLQKWPPRYDSYPAAPRDCTQDDPQVPDDPRTARYAGALWGGSDNKPTFAQCWRIVEIGCGTTCQQLALVHDVSAVVLWGPTASVGSEYRVDSKLLTVNPEARIVEAFGRGADIDWLHTQHYRFDSERAVLEKIPQKAEEP